MQIYEDEKVSYCIFPDPPCCTTTTRVGNENSYIFLAMHIFHSSKVKDYQRILSAKQNERKVSTKIQKLPKKSIYRAENLDGYKNTQYTNMYKSYQKNSIGRAGNLGRG